MTEGNVWIVVGPAIMGGVSMGVNSVVAVGLVVTKDVPLNMLAGGHPAKDMRALILCFIVMHTIC